MKRRADVVGIFPNEASITRLIGAVLFEQNDEWATRRRDMQAAALARIGAAEPDPILAYIRMQPDHDLRPSRNSRHLDGRDPPTRLASAQAVIAGSFTAP